MVNASKSPEKIKNRLKKAFRDLEEIKGVQQKGLRDLRKSFKVQVDRVVQQLSQHLLSDGVKSRFKSFSPEEAPDKDADWNEVEERFSSTLSRRFLEIVEQWEEENGVFSNTRLFLLEQLQNYFDEVEFKLQRVQSEATDDDSSNPRKLNFRVKLSAWQKATWNMTVIGCALWEVIESIRSLKFSDAYESVRRATSDVVQSLYKNLLSQFSEDLLADSVKKTLQPFVEDKLKDVNLYLDRTDARLQELIEADRKLYNQLTKRPARYGLVLEEVKEHWNQLAFFGLNDCVKKIDGEELEWKEETSSCLGRGAFGAVYKGTMIRDGEVRTDVAVKVWNMPLDPASAKEIMEEIKKLRYNCFIHALIIHLKKHSQ